MLKSIIGENDQTSSGSANRPNAPASRRHQQIHRQRQILVMQHRRNRQRRAARHRRHRPHQNPQQNRRLKRKVRRQKVRHQSPAPRLPASAARRSSPPVQPSAAGPPRSQQQILERLRPRQRARHRRRHAQLHQQRNQNQLGIGLRHTPTLPLRRQLAQQNPGDPHLASGLSDYAKSSA